MNSLEWSENRGTFHNFMITSLSFSHQNDFSGHTPIVNSTRWYVDLPPPHLFCAASNVTEVLTPGFLLADC